MPNLSTFSIFPRPERTDMVRLACLNDGRAKVTLTGVAPSDALRGENLHDCYKVYLKDIVILFVVIQGTRNSFFICSC